MPGKHRLRPVFLSELLRARYSGNSVALFDLLMNHLAHLYLARAEPESRLGNLLGDFRRQVDPTELSLPVRRGLDNHRHVDVLTDAHPLVVRGRRLFSRRRRRFAGVALDVVFDHFLIRHWSRFATQTLDDFVEEVYRDLEQTLHGLAEPARSSLWTMIDRDWLRACASLNSTGRVLDYLADRLRFSHEFTGTVDEIRVLDRELEDIFLGFFPQLRTEVARRDLEGDSGRSS